MPSIKRNFLYNILLNVSSVIFPLITAPYVARVLDPDGIGLANFANSYVGYFVLFALLGRNMYSVREVAKLRDNKATREEYVSQIISISAIHTVIATIIYIATVFLVPQFAENKLIFFIAGFSLYILPLQIDWYFSGMENFGHITKRSLIIRTISIIALFLFVKSKSDLYIYMLLSVISSSGNIIWNFILLKKEGIKPKFTVKGLKRHYKPMLILFSSSVAISVYTMLDTVMLGFMSTYTETGYYSSATHLAKAMLAIVTSLSAVAVPRIAYYMKQGDYGHINDLVSKSLGIVSFLAIPMTVGLICIAPTFVPLFLGKEFYGAIIPLMIMSGIITAIGFNNLTGIQILIGLGLDNRFLQSVLVGTFSNFILNLIVIPIWGASGAAAASVIAETLILFASIYLVKKHTKVKFGEGIHDVWKSAIASISFIPIAIILNKFTEGWWCVISTVLSCIVAYTMLQKLMKSNSYKMLVPIILNTPIIRKFVTH